MIFFIENDFILSRLVSNVLASSHLVFYVLVERGGVSNDSDIKTSQVVPPQVVLSLAHYPVFGNIPLQWKRIARQLVKLHIQ